MKLRTDLAEPPLPGLEDQVPACEWCHGPMPRSSATGRALRPDAIQCSKQCRQSSWRFGSRGPTNPQPDAPPMAFAYADPPYPGMAARYYADHPEYRGEVDHAELIDRLGEFDGWALSTSAKTLAIVLALCPPDVRVGAWTKPAPPHSTKAARNAWEPVIFHAGRPQPPDGAQILDWVHAAPMRDYPGRHGKPVVGTKPAAFSFWAFDCLGAQPQDRMADLFPGSGAVTRAWDRYRTHEGPPTGRPRGACRRCSPSGEP